MLSQSGALLTAVLDWSLREQVGFSAIVSAGSMLDVDWGDLISFFGEDPKTKSVLLYIESIADARSFLSAAREVALSKPIIVIKAGRTEAASKAASSHTGAMTGSDDVFDAALRRCGVLRVQSISDLFYMAEVLSKQPRPRGPRLTIVTNAGGPGVLATDALIPNGGELTPLSRDSIRALDAFLPAHWSHANPIDILGDADPERYAKAVEIAIADPSSDGLLVILAPQGMTSPAEVARRLAPHAKGHGKPVLASWMGGQTVAEGEAILNAAGIPTFAYPDTAARAFDYMWSYSSHLRGLYETPAITASATDSGARRRKAKELIDRTLAAGRALLTEVESKELLSLYGIPTVPTRVAHERLIRKCFIDYEREMALVAELTDAQARSTCIAGVARLSRLPSSAEAEIGVVVADKFQHQGLGSELIKKIVDIARIERIKRVVAEFHSENSAIHHLAKHGGATVERTSDPTCFRIQLDL